MVDKLIIFLFRSYYNSKELNYTIIPGLIYVNTRINRKIFRIQGTQNRVEIITKSQ